MSHYPRYLRNATSLINNKIIKFLITGGINTVFYYILYIVFLYVGLNYTIAAFFSTLLGVLFSFKSFGKYVFLNTDNHLIFRFAAVYIFLFFLNILFIYFFNLIVRNYYLAGFMAIFPYSIFSFYLNKNFVFNRH